MSHVGRRLRIGLVPATACLALALLPPLAIAQNADRPTVTVGDWWQFVEYYSVASTEPNRHWAITAVTSTGIEGTENGQPLTLTRDLNVVESPRGRNSNSMALSFPLEIGKQWRFDNDWLFKATGSKGTSSVEVKVVAYEKVAVPAGSFEAFKLVSTASMRGMSVKGSMIEGDATSTYWYAPAARAIVKAVTHNPYIGVSTVELVGFRR